MAELSKENTEKAKRMYTLGRSQGLVQQFFNTQKVNHPNFLTISDVFV